jgi:tetratricopeptide (TPR) repeat protein
MVSMSFNMNKFLGAIILITCIQGINWPAAGQNLDSLRMVWLNESLHDTVRLNAMEVLAWEGYGYSNPDSSYYYSQQLFDFAEKSGNKKWMAKAIKLQGNSFVIKSEYARAFGLFSRSLEISEEINDKEGIAGTLHSIGIIYYYQGDRSKALEYYIRSLKLKEEINDKKGLSGSLNNIGIVYSQQGTL